MSYPRWLLPVSACLVGASILPAAVTPKGPEELAASATDVVVGKVTGLEIKEEPGQSGYVDLALYYTLAVARVEKGEGIKPGDRVVVRAWKWKERKRPFVGDDGHRPLPAVGQEVRAYLRGRSVEHPNGFAPPGPVGGLTRAEFSRLQGGLPETDEVEPLRVDGSRGPAPAGGGGYGAAAAVAGAAAVGALVLALVLRGRAARQPGKGRPGS